MTTLPNQVELHNTPTLIDMLVAEYRQAVLDFNAKLPADQVPRNAEEELRQASHFIGFAKAWLGRHYVIRTLPAERDVAVQFEVGPTVRITGNADAMQQQEQARKPPSYIGV